MALDPNPDQKLDVRRIARLARIHVSTDDIAQLERDLTGILAWVKQLDEVNIQGVTPLAGGATIPLTLRDDVVTDGGDTSAILANAPERSGDFFTVPKVVE